MGMKDHLVDLWGRFKSLMEDVWDRVRRTMRDQRGAVGDLKAEFLRRYNGSLDKAEEAVKNRDEAGARKWLAEADALERVWEGKVEKQPPASTALSQDEWLKAARTRNPAVSDDDLRTYYEEKYGMQQTEPSPEEIRTTSIKNAVTEVGRADEGKSPEPVEPIRPEAATSSSTSEERPTGIKSVLRAAYRKLLNKYHPDLILSNHEASRIKTKQDWGKTMNRKQLSVIWVGVALVGLLLIFPPWRFVHYTPHIEYPGPYSPIYSYPPDIPYCDEDRFSGYRCVDWSARIDWERMTPPIALVVIVVGALLFTIRGKPTVPKE